MGDRKGRPYKQGMREREWQGGEGLNLNDRRPMSRSWQRKGSGGVRIHLADDAQGNAI